MKDLIAENKAWVDEIWEKIDHKLKLSVSRNKGKIPYTTVNGVYDNKAETDISWWTNGFWPGMMWLMYIDTKDDLYKETAVEAEVMLDKALRDYACLHHDVGFMWNISAGVDYRLFGARILVTVGLLQPAHWPAVTISAVNSSVRGMGTVTKAGRSSTV